jgi:uncharacterized protein (TIGR03435 family)
VLGAGDPQGRINRTGGPGGAQMSMSNPENGTTKVTMSTDGQMHMEFERMTMANLAQTLTPMLDRPVVDHTGLKGSFTIALDLSLQDMMQMARTAAASVPVMTVPLGGPAGGPGPGGLATAASDPSGGSIFTSVQKLGLKLEQQKTPIETIVVDSAEKDPSEN